MQNLAVKWMALASFNPGEKAKEWGLDQIEALFILILAVAAAICLIRRKVLPFVVLGVMAGLGALFIYNGAEVGKIMSDFILSLMK